MSSLKNLNRQRKTGNEELRGFDHQLSDKPEVAKYFADVRAQLDEAAFEAAWAEGQAMTLEQAVAYALDE